MKKSSYYIMLTMGLACVVMSIALIFIANANQKIQLQLQAQQQYLNSGILSQQGQAITAAVIQEMDSAAAKNTNIRNILEMYGLRKPGAMPAPAKTSEKEESKQ